MKVHIFTFFIWSNIIEGLIEVEKMRQFLNTKTGEIKYVSNWSYARLKTILNSYVWKEMFHND